MRFSPAPFYQVLRLSVRLSVSLVRVCTMQIGCLRPFFAGGSSPHECLPMHVYKLPFQTICFTRNPEGTNIVSIVYRGELPNGPLS